MASGDTKTQQYLDIAAHGTREDIKRGCCDTRTQSLILDIADRIIDVEEEVEEIKTNPDVADIVATYEDLENYDTSALEDRDIIRVLSDSTHDGNSTYYRYDSATDTFTYIGAASDGQNFIGTDGVNPGVHGLVPAPATTDVDKFLNADGTWKDIPEFDISKYLPTDTASGNVAAFPDGADSLPMVSLIVGIEPVQTGSGDPSPANIRPITGFTGTTITHTAKNLLDTSRVELGTFNQTTGEPTAGSGNQQRMTYYIKVNPGDKIVQTNSKSENNRAFFYNGSTYVSTSALANGTAVTVPNGVDRMYVSSAASGWTGASAPTWAQIEFGSTATATDYEPYDADTYNISWQSEAGTIYGGSLNVTTGVLTVDTQRFVMDGTTRKVTYTSTSGGYRLFVGLAPSPSIVGAGTAEKPYLSNMFKMKYTAATGQAYMSGGNGQQITMYLPDQTIDNLDDANTWLEQNQPEFVVALATPVTYQLTPIEVDTFLGANNIWNDTGDTTATYKADIQGYIDKKIANTNLSKSAPKNLLGISVDDSDDNEEEPVKEKLDEEVVVSKKGKATEDLKDEPGEE